MLPPHPDSHFVGLYRTQDRSATLAGWADVPALPPGMQAQVACYAPVSPRWNAFDVAHSSPAGCRAEARARVAIGDKVHWGFPAHLSVG